ncbi:hypothetical protein [Virgibacillus ihumii]|nr:hypothetical protein [Virgibacillus ihumii]
MESRGGEGVYHKIVVLEKIVYVDTITDEEGYKRNHVRHTGANDVC